MKLLYCKNCQSIFNLSFKIKTCECKQTKGKYINNSEAVYCGQYAKPMGLNNRDMAIELEKTTSKHIALLKEMKGKYIQCWFIRKDDCCSTFIKVKVKDLK